MSDSFKPNSFKRKNAKNLTLNKAPAKAPNPSDGEAQIPGANGNSESNRTDTLEIGLEFKLDLRSEDLIFERELGAGNGGTVSKVSHASTKVVMARKVRASIKSTIDSVLTFVSTDHSTGCKRERSQADRKRITGRTRLQLTICHYVLWCFSK